MSPLVRGFRAPRPLRLEEKSSGEQFGKRAAFLLVERLQKCSLGLVHNTTAVSLFGVSRAGQREEIAASALRGAGSLDQTGIFHVVDDGDDRGAVDAEPLAQASAVSWWITYDLPVLRHWLPSMRNGEPRGGS